MLKHRYTSDIELGERYRDTQTGIEGIATAIYFFQHACERAQIERVKSDGELQENVFDAPRLVHVKSQQQARSDRPGGPARTNEGLRPGPR
jgi:hypothetical protein